MAEKKRKTRAEKEAIDVAIKFIKSILSDRIATYSRPDMVQETVQMQQKRQKHEEDRKARYRCSDICEIINVDPCSTSCEDENNSESSTIEPKSKHRRILETGSSYFCSS